MFTQAELFVESFLRNRRRDWRSSRSHGNVVIKRGVALSATRLRLITRAGLPDK